MATIERYETKDGTTFYAVRYRKPDGGTTRRRSFGTKHEAELWAAKAEVDKARGEFVAPKLGRITVAELAPKWLARKQKLAPSHYRMLESGWRVHVQPRWGTTAVADVDLLGVEEWIDDMVTNGSGATTVLRAYGVLAGILSDAVKGKRLAVNPAKGPTTCRARRASGISICLRTTWRGWLRNPVNTVPWC
jgi:hypothetical protein